MNKVTAKISDYLTDKQVLFFLADLPKEQMFEKLIATMTLPDPKLALQAVLDRESWGSTEIAPGLALPHARIQGIKHIVAAIGICPAKVFILFLGPADQTQENLSFLAAASAVFQTPGLLENLLTLKTPESVLSKIREAEELL